MAEYDLVSGGNAIGFGKDGTVGITATGNVTTDETVAALFSPQLLKEWAEAVSDAHAHDFEVEVLLTPDGEMIATKSMPEEPEIGISVAPRERNDDEETDEETEEIELGSVDDLSDPRAVENMDYVVSGGDVYQIIVNGYASEVYLKRADQIPEEYWERYDSGETDA